MRILRNGSIYDAALREVVRKRHACIRTSFPQRVRKALIKRKYESEIGMAIGKLHFRIIPPEHMEWEEYMKKAQDISHALAGGKDKERQKFILEVTLS